MRAPTPTGADGDRNRSGAHVGPLRNPDPRRARRPHWFAWGIVVLIIAVCGYWTWASWRNGSGAPNLPGPGSINSAPPQVASSGGRQLSDGGFQAPDSPVVRPRQATQNDRARSMTPGAS